MFELFILSITAMVIVASIMEHKESKTFEINKKKED